MQVSLRKLMLIGAGAFAVLGLLFAGVVLVGTVFGVGDPFFTIGATRVTGLVAACLGLPVMAGLFGLVGALGGALLYALFAWLRRA